MAATAVRTSLSRLRLSPPKIAPRPGRHAVKEFARAHEADLVGIVRLDPLWVFEGYEASEPWLIVLGVAMDYDRLSTAPDVTAGVEVMETYNRGTRAARELANWISRPRLSR